MPLGCGSFRDRAELYSSRRGLPCPLYPKDPASNPQRSPGSPQASVEGLRGGSKNLELAAGRLEEAVSIPAEVHYYPIAFGEWGRARRGPKRPDPEGLQQAPCWVGGAQ